LAGCIPLYITIKDFNLYKLFFNKIKSNLYLYNNAKEERTTN